MSKEICSSQPYATKTPKKDDTEQKLLNKYPITRNIFDKIVFFNLSETADDEKKGYNCLHIILYVLKHI